MFCKLQNSQGLSKREEIWGNLKLCICSMQDLKEGKRMISCRTSSVISSLILVSSPLNQTDSGNHKEENLEQCVGFPYMHCTQSTYMYSAILMYNVDKALCGHN